MDFITALILMVAGSNNVFYLPVGAPVSEVMQQCVGEMEIPGKLTIDDGRWKMVVSPEVLDRLQGCSERQAEVIFNQKKGESN